MEAARDEYLLYPALRLIFAGLLKRLTRVAELGGKRSRTGVGSRSPPHSIWVVCRETAGARIDSH